MKNYKFEIAKYLVRNMKYGIKSVKPTTIEKQYYDEEILKAFNEAAIEMQRNGLIKIETFEFSCFIIPEFMIDNIKLIRPMKGREMDLMRFMIEESNKKEVRERK